MEACGDVLSAREMREVAVWSKHHDTIQNCACHNEEAEVKTKTVPVTIRKQK